MCLVAAAVALAVRVPDASRPGRRERRRSIPIVAGLRELVARPPAGMVMTSFLAQTRVRGALTTFLAILAIEVLGMGDGGVGVLGAAIGLGGIAGALGALALGTERRLAVVFALALFLWGAPIAVIGFVPVTVVAIVALAVVGIANALLDVSGLTLLQRGTANDARSAVFAVLEVVASIGVSVGGVLASLLIADARDRAGAGARRPVAARDRRRRLAARPAARRRGRDPRAAGGAAARDPAVRDAPAGGPRARRDRHARGALRARRAADDPGRPRATRSS